MDVLNAAVEFTSRFAPFGRRQVPYLVGKVISGCQESGWATFRDNYLAPDGRIVDPENDNITHSEGQAWGMLLAAIHQDEVAFNRIKSWTDTHLAIRGDALLAWRFRTSPTRGVDDTNAATDADLCHAWALLRASQRWPDRGFAEKARRIAFDVLRLCVRMVGDRVLLLPGPQGFVTTEQTIINPSYYVFPALDALRDAFPHPAWAAVIGHGEQLLERTRFGRWQLPADWVTLRGPALLPEPQRGRGDRFGYDALRAPLYLAWSGRWHAGSVIAARAFWQANSTPQLPAWVRLSDGALAPYAAGAGVAAIYRFISQQDPLAAPRSRPPSGRGYYQQALLLLAQTAMREAPPPPRIAQGEVRQDNRLPLQGSAIR